MTPFYYDPANELAPIKKGDVVEIVNSQGVAVGKQKVRRVGAVVITTACGRNWTRTHGEWVSELRGKNLTIWPFPSIRKLSDNELSPASGTEAAEGGRDAQQLDPPDDSAVCNAETPAPSPSASRVGEG